MRISFISRAFSTLINFCKLCFCNECFLFKPRLSFLNHCVESFWRFKSVLNWFQNRQHRLTLLCLNSCLMSLIIIRLPVLWSKLCRIWSNGRINLGNVENRTQGLWVRIMNATSVLCSGVIISTKFFMPFLLLRRILTTTLPRFAIKCHWIFSQVVPAALPDNHGGLDVNLHLPDECPWGHFESSPGNK